MKSVLSLSSDELRALVLEGGGKPFHHTSLLTWLYQRGATNFALMSDLPEELRRFLAERIELLGSRIVDRRLAPDGTAKLLIEMHDGEKIETVVMPGSTEEKGWTICVSTQVGCPVACRFCASGAHGVVRNLEWWEIVEQFLHARTVHPIARAVIMGIGEPTLNIENLVKALGIVTDTQGFGLGARKITISTVGYPDKIAKLAKTGKPYNLAVSLHAPSDALRQEIIPTMRKTSIEEIIAAANGYFEETGREVTFEYVLLAGTNDLPQHADELARRLRGTRSTVNLIPYNPIPGSPYKRPSLGAVNLFQRTLERAHIPTTVRWSKGVEADAACGQLRIQGREN